MPDATTEFFERLSGSRPVPVADLPPTVKGTIRVDIHGDRGIEHWYVTLGKGEALASRKQSRPNAVVRGSRQFFDRLVRGEEHFYASVHRNEIELEGNSALAAHLIRLLPGSPGAHDPRPATRLERPTA